MFHSSFGAAVRLRVAKECCIKSQHATVFGSLAVGAFFLFVTPVVFQRSEELPVRSTLTFLKSLGPNQDVQILEAEGGLHFYLAPGWHRVAEYSKKGSFDAFRERTHINAILLTERLATDSRFRSDHEWLQFLSDPDAYGFARMAIPGTEFHLLHKKGLFSMSAEVESRIGRATTDP